MVTPSPTGCAAVDVGDGGVFSRDLQAVTRLVVASKIKQMNTIRRIASLLFLPGLGDEGIFLANPPIP
jgi:hypothetical protein